MFSRLQSFFLNFKVAYLIFAISFMTYLSIGCIFSFYTNIVYHPNYICDLYLGYDNALHHTSFVRHPFVRLVSYLLSFVGIFFKDTTYISVFLCLICSTLLSFQNFFLFKILKNILKLSNKKCFVVLCIFGLMATNLLLCFTFDSYVFSACLMMFFMYRFLLAEQKNEPIPKYEFFLTGFLIAGTTVTNFFKVFITCIYPKKNRALYLKRSVFIVAVGLVFFVYLWFQAKESLFFISNFAGKSQFFYKEVINYFFGALFLIPKIDVVLLRYIDGSFFYSVLGGFNNVFGNLLIFGFLFLIILILFLERKNKIVKVLILSFLIDLFLHVILRMGLNEAYIFTGNYNYILGILIAIGFKNYTFVRFKLHYVFFMLFLMSFFFNIIALGDLLQFGVTYYGR